jgi:hypothetical protein
VNGERIANRGAHDITPPVTVVTDPDRDDCCIAISQCSMPSMPSGRTVQLTASSRIDHMELVFFAFVGSLALIAAMVVKGEI